MKYFVFMLLIVGCAGGAIPLYAQVPQCRQISMDHFGGNRSDVMGKGVVMHENGTFSMIVGTLSTVGSIRTDCGIGGAEGVVFRTYAADYSTLLGQTCSRQGQNFTGPAFFVYPLANGDTVLIGQSDLQSGDLGIEKRDAAGNLVWSKHYGGTGFEKFITAVPGPDGGYFLAGDAHSNDGDVGLHYGDYFSRDIWIVKVDSNGNKMWTKVLGGTKEDVISNIVPTPDGGCYLFGETVSDDHDMAGPRHGSNNGDIYIARLDSLGNKLWHRCYGGTKGDGTGDLHATTAIKDGKGGFYIGASTQSADGDVRRRQPEGFDIWAFHIDSVGTLLWENTFGGPGWDFMRAFCRAADGSLWIGGSTQASGGQVKAFYGMQDAWVVHVDTAGNFINSRTLGADKEEHIWALHPLADASILAIGAYTDYITPGNTSPGFPLVSEGYADIFIARLGPDNDLAITDVLPPDSWELFPNPSNGQLTIRTKTGANGKYRARILDAAGRAIYKHSFRRELKVATGGWQPGIYIVER